MNVTELCEPLFLYVCRLNRSARKGATVEYHQTRGEIEAIFETMRATAGTHPGLLEQYDKLELAIIFFVDSMISESDLSFARDWHDNRMAYERHERAGDEKFFDILDETLAERSPEGAERIAVLYACIGLGFGGWYRGQPEHLRRKMNEAAARLNRKMDADETMRLCPQAYDHTDTRALSEPVGMTLLGITICVVGILLTVLTANYFAYRTGLHELTDVLTTIEGVESWSR